jgi:hypothetical protein
MRAPARESWSASRNTNVEFGGFVAVAEATQQTCDSVVVLISLLVHINGALVVLVEHVSGGAFVVAKCATACSERRADGVRVRL